ncbi:Putative uncharacterized protein [Moritella viscosa]|nr:Putative uncharacterized protein [Moritella viscosa]
MSRFDSLCWNGKTKPTPKHWFRLLWWATEVVMCQSSIQTITIIGL